MTVIYKPDYDRTCQFFIVKNTVPFAEFEICCDYRAPPFITIDSRHSPRQLGQGFPCTNLRAFLLLLWEEFCFFITFNWKFIHKIKFLNVPKTPEIT